MPSCIAAALTAVKSLIVVLLVSARVRGRSAVEEGGDGVAGRFLVRLVLGVRALRADELLVDVLELLLDDAELSVEVLVGPQEGIGGVALPASHQVLDLVAESLLGLVDLARLLLDLLRGLGHFCAINGGVARHGSSIRFRGSSPGLSLWPAGPIPRCCGFVVETLGAAGVTSHPVLRTFRPS